MTIKKLMATTLAWGMLLTSFSALATEIQPELSPTPLPSNIEIEGFAIEEIPFSDYLADKPASIEGKTPLYTTKIKPFSTGNSITMRAKQSFESEAVCSIREREVVTIYEVLPSFVLAEYEGNVGYIIRTWVDENMTAINPETTPPYGVNPMKYVATLTQDNTKIHIEPDANSEFFDITPNAGSKISIVDFVDGFAQVIYYRSYGYIDATQLTDLVTVSPIIDPLSNETPIAAFSSFFYFNTGDDGNEGRCLNIIRSCERMSTILEPGEVLDFNNDVGPYKKANGYHAAPVLIDGGSQLGYGGGTCQSSSTLYNAIRQLPDITVLHRRPHGPGCARYLPMHQDAAVGGGSEINFVFRNDYPYPLQIVADSTGEGSISIQIFKAN